MAPWDCPWAVLKQGGGGATVHMIAPWHNILTALGCVELNGVTKCATLPVVDDGHASGDFRVGPEISDMASPQVAHGSFLPVIATYFLAQIGGTDDNVCGSFLTWVVGFPKHNLQTKTL